MKGKPTTPIVIGQHSKAVTGLAMINETTLVSGSLDCSVNTWDLRQPGFPVRSVSIDGRWLDLKHYLRMWLGCRALVCIVRTLVLMVSSRLLHLGSPSSVMLTVTADAVKIADRVRCAEKVGAADAILLIRVQAGERHRGEPCRRVASRCDNRRTLHSRSLGTQRRNISSGSEVASSGHQPALEPCKLWFVYW